MRLPRKRKLISVPVIPGVQYKLVRYIQIPVNYTPSQEDYVPTVITENGKTRRQLQWKPF